MDLKQRISRADNVNQLLEVVGSCGRKFFHYQGRYGKIEVDERGRLWFVNEYSLSKVYLHYRYWDRGFGHGGTLRALVDDLKKYIMTGNPINRYHFGPWSQTICEGDLWGYGEDIVMVRAEAFERGIIQFNPDCDCDNDELLKLEKGWFWHCSDCGKYQYTDPTDFIPSGDYWISGNLVGI